MQTMIQNTLEAFDEHDRPVLIHLAAEQQSEDEFRLVLTVERTHPTDDSQIESFYMPVDPSFAAMLMTMGPMLDGFFGNGSEAEPTENGYDVLSAQRMAIEEGIEEHGDEANH